MNILFFKIILSFSIFFSLFSDSHESLIKEFSWHPRALAVEITVKKMWKNSNKAIEEHKKKDPSSAYASLTDALPPLESFLIQKNLHPLKFFYSASEAQGPREFMEDAHFFKELEEGAIIGVLDGHGGGEVARYAKELFLEYFPLTLITVKGNIHQAFEILIDEIHKKIATKNEWSQIGSTAVLCFINKYTHQIYTATLGDSEANIYRKNKQGCFQSIPLSCVRDWSSAKDAKRAAIALERPYIASLWPKTSNPKCLRYPSPYFGINVSRSLGDVALTGSFEKPAVIHKPKITINQLQTGDILILGCDGLKDYVLENEIIDQLNQKKTSENLAEQLVNYAINAKYSLDNVTVLSLSIY